MKHIVFMLMASLGVWKHFYSISLAKRSDMLVAMWCAWHFDKHQEFLMTDFLENVYEWNIEKKSAPKNVFFFCLLQKGKKSTETKFVTMKSLQASL